MLVVNGNRVLHKIPRKISNKELLGIMEKIALYVFKKRKEDKIKIVYDGKEGVYYRIDFKRYFS